MRSAAPATQRTSDGFEVFREDLDLLPAVVADQNNVVIGPEAFHLNSYGYQGFVHDLISDYRVLSVIRTGPGAAFFISKQARGTYYPAFIMYDEQGAPDQVVTLFVGNERKGVAVAANHDNRCYLFVLSEACEFSGTALITLMTPDTGGGSYRIENLLLLKEMPQQAPRSYSFSSVRAVPYQDHGQQRARITWITDWATRSRLEYGLSGAYGNRVETEEMPIAPSAATYAQVYVPPVTTIYNNHRLLLSDLQADQTYHFRLLGTTPDGTEVVSQEHSFSTVARSRPKGSVARGWVPLQVTNQAPVARRRWPVTAGIPFPQGALAVADHTRLEDVSGEEVALQSAVLAEWPDGSVKWLLLDFQADLGAGAGAGSEYRLEYGTAVVRRGDLPRTPLQVTDNGSQVTVLTGPLKLLLDRREACFPARVWIDTNGDGRFSAAEEITDPQAPGAMELVSGDGTSYHSRGAPYTVEVEECGPLRSVIKVTGQHRAVDGSRLFCYVTRINAYAGKDFVRVLHTWENDHVADNFTTVRSLMLRTPLRLDGATTTLCGSQGEVYRSAAEPTLEQLDVDGYTVTEGSAVRRCAGRAQGTVDLSDANRGLTVAVREFWQNYPKSLGIEGRSPVVEGSGPVGGGRSLGVAGKNLVVGLCPPLPADRYDDCEEELEDKLYYYLQGGAYKFKRGVSRTHELIYRFHAGAASNVALHLQEPLRARAPAAWYCASKAFGDVAVADPEQSSPL